MYEGVYVQIAEDTLKTGGNLCDLSKLGHWKWRDYVGLDRQVQVQEQLELLMLAS